MDYWLFDFLNDNSTVIVILPTTKSYQSMRDIWLIIRDDSFAAVAFVKALLHAYINVPLLHDILKLAKMDYVFNISFSGFLGAMVVVFNARHHRVH